MSKPAFQQALDMVEGLPEEQQEDLARSSVIGRESAAAKLWQPVSSKPGRSSLAERSGEARSMN
jgi:hypothetical protein